MSHHHPETIFSRSVLVLGGARSGKSRFAQGLAEASGKAPILIATARADDDEMRTRIAHHRAARGNRWRTIEEPIALAATLSREAAPHNVLVVDCLTLWLSNLSLEGRDVARATEEAIAVIGDLAGPVIFVSNEVGSGIVPDNALARTFRDAHGRLNQAIGEACTTVVLMSAGLPYLLKPARMPRIEF
jgi:adenosylcobinamide kinase/adenosylcobinamide-phosphate guanylyltransferase